MIRSTIVSLSTKLAATTLLVVAIFATNPLSANAINVRMELGVNGATIGDLGDSLGIEAAYFVNPNLRVRLNYSQLSYQNNRTVGSINFVETMDQSNAKLSVDWFPWLPENGLFASFGVTNLGDPASLSATVNDSLNYSLGDVLYSGAQLGTISGRVETETNLPYIGVGYKYDFGNRQGSGAFVQAEVGSVFGLKTQLKLSSDNPNNLANLNTSLQSYADQQNEKFEDSYALYGLTIGYRF